MLKHNPISHVHSIDPGSDHTVIVSYWELHKAGNSNHRPWDTQYFMLELHIHVN